MVEKKDTVRIMFFGDLALHGDAAHAAQRGATDFFGDLPDLFRQADIVIGNLESPLPGDGNENLLKHPRVIGDLNAFHYLNVLKPDILSLANNHLYDALYAGYRNTVTFLDECGIKYLGAGVSEQEARRPVLMECNGLKIGILAYVSHETNPNLPPDTDVFLNFFDLSCALKDISKLRLQTDICVVLLHWGVDFCHFPSPQQRNVVFSLVSAGANLIVGAHSHVIQPVEMISGTLVAYGLGNFFFPDIISEGYERNWERKNKESLILDVILNEVGIYKVKYHRTVQHGTKIRIGSNGIRRYIWKLRCISYFLRQAVIWETYLIFRERKQLIYRYLYKRKRTPIGQLLSLRPRHIIRLFLSKNGLERSEDRANENKAI